MRGALKIICNIRVEGSGGNGSAIAHPVLSPLIVPALLSKLQQQNISKADHSMFKRLTFPQITLMMTKLKLIVLKSNHGKLN